MTGPGCRSLHLAIDDIVTDVREHSDTIAERIRALRAIADGRISTAIATGALQGLPLGKIGTEATVTHAVDLLHGEPNSVLPEAIDLLETIGADTRPALLCYARSIAPGKPPTHRTVRLVLIGLLAGFDVDIRRSIDDHDLIDGAVIVATDLVRKLRAGGAEFSGTETGGSDSEAAVPVTRRTDQSVPDRQTGWHALTETERTVARLIADGFTNEQAARKLGRSKHTIGTHLRSAFVKMQVQSRVQLRNAMAGRDDRRQDQEPTA